MIDFVRQLNLRHLLKSYLFKLGPALASRYGHCDQYTVMQIEKTAVHLKLNMRRIRYAIALYRHDESKNSMVLYAIDQALLDRLRQEVASLLFYGDTTYTAKDAIKLGMPTGWRGGRPNAWVTRQAMYHEIGGR